MLPLIVGHTKSRMVHKGEFKDKVCSVLELCLLDIIAGL